LAKINQLYVKSNSATYLPVFHNMNYKIEQEAFMSFNQFNNCNGYIYGLNNQIRRAVAYITGGPSAPDLKGIVVFTDVPGGTEVTAEVSGLPAYKPAAGGNPPVGPFGFHLHENGSCAAGEAAEPFTASGGHWNPTNQPHGNHAGDFPVLFSNGGYARMSFFTNKFSAAQVIGKAVIIHENPDDYRSQPAGASGKRIACGVIKEFAY
jgi:Cu-Zn family superoxide dismutase